MTTRKVFVYGTLMKGDRNADILEGQNYLGQTQTLHPQFKMIEKRSSSAPGALTPGVLENGTSHIAGECYEINQATFEMLDALEELDNKYKRVQIDLLNFGQAWIYILLKQEQKTHAHAFERVLFNRTNNLYSWKVL